MTFEFSINVPGARLFLFLLHRKNNGTDALRCHVQKRMQSIGTIGIQHPTQTQSMSEWGAWQMLGGSEAPKSIQLLLHRQFLYY